MPDVGCASAQSKSTPLEKKFITTTQHNAARRELSLVKRERNLSQYPGRQIIGSPIRQSYANTIVHVFADKITHEILTSELERPVTDHGRAVHVPRKSLIIIGLGRVHRTPVVPEHEIAFLPFVPVDECRLRTMCIQSFQRLGAVVWRDPDDALNQLNAEIKRLATGLRMGADEWVQDTRQTADLIVAEFEILMLMIVSMLRLQTIEPFPFALR